MQEWSLKLIGKGYAFTVDEFKSPQHTSKEESVSILKTVWLQKIRMDFWTVHDAFVSHCILKKVLISLVNCINIIGKHLIKYFLIFWLSLITKCRIDDNSVGFTVDLISTFKNVLQWVLIQTWSFKEVVTDSDQEDIF